ncbi:MAG: ABC transporter substrate-binding protein [Thermoleophilia bacterium]|nr:ABC transporter substrate-binding protein [Thermoleophilia bacterium]
MSVEKPISRRDFLRLAGRAGVALGLGSGLGGLLAGCDDDATLSTNTTVTIPPSQTSTTATTAPPVTTASTVTTAVSGPERGRPLRIGVVSAKTGPLALFGKADDWWIALGSEAVREGIVCGDGRLRLVTFSVRDCRSIPSVAAGTASELISSERVDLVMCSGSSDIVLGVVERAETLGCPCLADFVEWRSLLRGRKEAAQPAFKWTYAHAFSLDDVAANYAGVWTQLSTNKKVGLVLPDDTDGRVWADTGAGLAATLAEFEYEWVMPGLYKPGAGDFAPHIAEFTKSGCEICCCLMQTADFLTFWTQATQQAYRPKIVTVSRGLLFPQALEAAGAGAQNTTAECLWQPEWPYSDSLTGMTARELADDYQSKTGEQWTVALAQYAKFEWAVHAFKEARSIIDKEHVLARVRAAKLDTCRGPLDLTIPVAADASNRGRRPAENVYTAPVGGAQWVKGARFLFEPALVARAGNLDLSIGGRLQPMVYQ